MRRLAPSLLEADFRFLDEQLRKMERAGADQIHIDVMDGSFVPNLALGMREIRSIRQSTALPFDVHMMVQEPGRFVERMAEAGADVITVHYEACEDPEETIDRIRNLGAASGIALKPDTDLSVLSERLLQKVDVVQLMTVQPGLEGQEFLPESLSRIRKVRGRIEALGLTCEVEVDGKIGIGNVQEVVRAGASVIVSGRALFAGDLEENIRRMKQQMEQELS